LPPIPGKDFWDPKSEFGVFRRAINPTGTVDFFRNRGALYIFGNEPDFTDEANTGGPTRQDKIAAYAKAYWNFTNDLKIETLMHNCPQAFLICRLRKKGAGRLSKTW
jgi:hypothetical protein